MRQRFGLLSLAAVMSITMTACGRDQTDQSAEYGTVGSDSVIRRDSVATPAAPGRTETARRPSGTTSRADSIANAERMRNEAREANERAERERADRERATRRSLPAGTAITLQNDATISSRHQNVGDRISASSTVDVLDASNRVVIPAGTKFLGTITRIESASGSGDTARLDLQFNAIEVNGNAVPMALEVTGFDVVARGRGVTAEQAGKVGAGAVIGGVAGRVIGGNTRGAVVGAVVGGAAGAVVANATRETDIVVDRGGAIQVRLTREFTQSVASN